MRAKDDEETENENLEEEEDEVAVPGGRSARSFAMGVVTGALVGAAVALLLAPAPGRVTRRRLRRRLQDARDRAEGGWERLGKRAKREIDRVRAG